MKRNQVLSEEINLKDYETIQEIEDFSIKEAKVIPASIVVDFINTTEQSLNKIKEDLISATVGSFEKLDDCYEKIETLLAKLY